MIDTAHRAARGRDGKGVQPELQFQDMVMDGPASAIRGVDVEVVGNSLEFTQGKDPALVSSSAKQGGYAGIALRGDEALVMDWNPSAPAGQKIVAGPVDTGGCTDTQLGDLSCDPVPLSKTKMVGEASIRLNRFEAIGLRTSQNPDFDPTVPPGDAVSCRGCERVEIGGQEFDQVQDDCVPVGNFPPSEIVGWETGVYIEGPANVVTEKVHGTGTGVAIGRPLAHRADLNPANLPPVPPSVTCLQNLRIHEVSQGVVFASNTENFMRDSEVYDTEYFAVAFGNANANLVTAAEVSNAGGSCDLHDNLTACQTASNDMAVPDSAPDSKDFRSNVAQGLSAKQRIVLEDNWLGLSPETLVPSTGQNPVIPDFNVDPQTLVMSQPTSNLTAARRPLATFATAIRVSTGPDVAVYPELLNCIINRNNIALNGVAIVVDNFNATGPGGAVQAQDNCIYDSSTNDCVENTPTAPPVVASQQQEEAAEIAALEVEMLAQPAPDLEPAGTQDEQGNPNDQCPGDPNKADPGVCGCGVADIDTDDDGTLDCDEACPNDPDKTDPGECGCVDVGFELMGTACGDQADTDCDNPDICDGAGVCLDNFEPATTICRPADGECDLEERCPGDSGSCPANVFNDGAACDDGNVCTTGETCSAGVCVPGTDNSGTIEVHAVTHTVGAGSHPGSTKAPLVGLLVGIYNKSAGSCARVTCGGISHQDYACIASGDGTNGPCVPEAEGTTDMTGQVTFPLPAGDYLVIGGDGTDKHLGVSASDLACGDFMQKHLQQLVTANGKKHPAKSSKRTGSELLVIEPEYVEWTGTEELYPVVFESLGDWSVTTSVSPPEGFVVDNDSLFEEVNSETEAVQFTITDVGSDWVPTEVQHVVEHKGRRETVLTRIGVQLSAKLARQKGLDRAGHVLDANGHVVLKTPGFDPREKPAAEIVGWIEPSEVDPDSTVKLRVLSPSEVTLSITRGQRGKVVHTLASEVLESGEYEFVWDGLDTDGHDLRPGNYFLTLVAGNVTKTVRIMSNDKN